MNTQVVHSNPRFLVRRDRYFHPRLCREFDFYYVEKEPAVVVIAREGDTLFLVRQYRYTANSDSLEFPIGSTSHAEEPSDGARRELREETGLVPERLSLIGKMWEVPGYTRSTAYIYLAENLRIEEPSREEPEQDMEVHRYTIPEIKALIASGTIRDSLTISAFFKFLLFQEE